MKSVLTACFLLLTYLVQSQNPDFKYGQSIQSAQLLKNGNSLNFPVLKLNSSDELQLYFDDLDAKVKNYYYTYQLCNSDWSVSSLNSFNYIKGFQNVRINTYRNSSIALTPYIHYQANIPSKSSVITRSGNYLLKIFLDADTAKLVFTKQFIVVDKKVDVVANVLQPFSGEFFRTHQKVQIAFTVNQQLNVFSPQDFSVVILQNNVWNSAVTLINPSVFRDKYFEYNDELLSTFSAGKAWRWIDLRSFKLMSERMTRLEKKLTQTNVFVKTDEERQQQPLINYRDINGVLFIETTDNVNPFWQADYATVHFSFSPPANKAYYKKDVYLFGELTNYAKNENAKMRFNEEKGMYETELFLKQGFYNYTYCIANEKNQTGQNNFKNLDGNYWATDNSYTVLVYYHPFGGRADELVGVTTINSNFQIRSN
ncbi:MAG: DUF5103 domain-containing protein [Chitinophagaceae bacterium]|nr:MAG: DUF5103 domain-containing protein [Chitinophagaceae bacterium]